MSEYTCRVETCVARVCLTPGQERDARERGTIFYCAAGHPLSFEETEVQRLRRALDTRTRERNYWQRKHRLWRCPFAHCDCVTESPGSLAAHLVRRHGARKTVLEEVS